MPTPAPHSFCRIIRVGDQSLDIAADDPEAGDMLAELASARCPVLVERTTSTSYRIRELSEDELRQQRGKLVEAMPRAWANRGAK